MNQLAKLVDSLTSKEVCAINAIYACKTKAHLGQKAQLLNSLLINKKLGHKQFGKIIGRRVSASQFCQLQQRVLRDVLDILVGSPAVLKAVNTLCKCQFDHHKSLIYAEVLLAKGLKQEASTMLKNSILSAEKNEHFGIAVALLDMLQLRLPDGLRFPDYEAKKKLKSYSEEFLERSQRLTVIHADRDVSYDRFVKHCAALFVEGSYTEVLVQCSTRSYRNRKSAWALTHRLLEILALHSTGEFDLAFDRFEAYRKSLARTDATSSTVLNVFAEVLSLLRCGLFDSQRRRFQHDKCRSIIEQLERLSLQEKADGSQEAKVCVLLWLTKFYGLKVRYQVAAGA